MVKFHIISRICTHTPTEEKEDAVKASIYANLEVLYDKCPGSDVKIVLGDFNAKVGQEGIFMDSAYFRLENAAVIRKANCLTYG